MEFKLENPGIDLRGKSRKNIHIETKNRALRLTMAEIAKWLYDLRDVRARDLKRAETWDDRERAQERLNDVDSFESFLEYKFKHFRVCNGRSLDEIETTIETKGKR